METVLGILFLVMLIAFIVVTICITGDYEKELEDAKNKAQADEIANKIEICIKNMVIKEKYKELQSAYAKIELIENEIKKLKRRKKE